jgi:hypothetical protein
MIVYAHSIAQLAQSKIKGISNLLHCRIPRLSRWRRVMVGMNDRVAGLARQVSSVSQKDPFN